MRIIAKKKFRNKQEILRDIRLTKLKKNLQEVKMESYHNKKVKLNTKDYDFRIKNGELSQRFIDWLNNNKNKTFIAKQINESTYELEGVDIWRFTYFDLEEVDI